MITALIADLPKCTHVLANHSRCKEYDYESPVVVQTMIHELKPG
jgi:hypothetical protein